ncbi:amino acid-binding protein [Faecalicatena acetigenes]|uniref:Amino acid-binding protein n=1 Tax=Faecalicatena acetigenes TaxID=2981790 RepID=A0ABT2TBH2_9FIRM|nr:MULTISPECIES: ACT domain-containing protein [Lachnospiraceae]MCU6747625.1 amino acid-binding protein [Faecalicatena acetigenes]SCH99548.1 ACT domain-containing protein [uncultured Clostridium sp.]
MIKQLSVFVENQPGSMMNVTSALVDAHINIRAISTFDTPEFGIMRLVVDKPKEAKEYLTKEGFVVRITDVIGAELKDEKGNLNQMLTILAEGKINVNYIYSFVIRAGKAPVMVFHTDDFERAEEVLKAANVQIVKEDELE